MSSFGHTTCTGGKVNNNNNNLYSKPTPIHVPVHKSELHFSYTKRHFSLSPKVVSKGLINILSQKVIYASMTIDLVIIGFIPNELSIPLHIFDWSIINFGERGLFLGFSNTYYADSLEFFLKAVLEIF